MCLYVFAFVSAIREEAAQFWLQTQGYYIRSPQCFKYMFCLVTSVLSVRVMMMFQANVRTYYQQFEEQQTQSLIDQRIKEHLGQAAAYNQVGAVFNQHMLARPRLPMMPMPMGMRPPVLPRPMMPGQGNVCLLEL